MNRRTPHRLTERQASVLSFVREYAAKNGFSPSYRDVAARFGFRSLRTVQDHLAALERKGVLSAPSLASGRRAARAISPGAGWPLRVRPDGAASLIGPSAFFGPGPLEFYRDAKAGRASKDAEWWAVRPSRSVPSGRPAVAWLGDEARKGRMTKDGFVPDGARSAVPARLWGRLCAVIRSESAARVPNGARTQKT